MGSGARSGFSGSDKAAAIECDVGLGLKMQRTESLPCRKTTVMSSHIPYYQPRLSSPSESCGGGGGFGSGGGGGGPIFYNASNQVAYMSDIPDVIGAGASSVALPRTLHHFNTDTTFKPIVAAAGMAASIRAPFTAAQWQELERQTIIYKYMMAAVPVPPELLIPIGKRLADVAPNSHSNRALGLGYSNGSDPEPWRCRRTDGKKWRCSRDVAPDQKYCERHAHKNRPRSRKPVEVLHPHIINNNKAHSLNLPAPNTTNKTHFLNQTNHHISPLQTVVSATSYDQPRCSDWFLKGETATVANSSQQWQQLMQQSKVGLKKDNNNNTNTNTNFYKNVCVFQQQHEEPMNSNLGTGLGNGQGLQNEQCSLLLGHKLVSFEGALNLDQTERSRDFIDAWSTAERNSIEDISNKCSGSSNGKMPLSSLTLSMSGGNENNEENENAQMGLGIVDSERENGGGGVKSQPMLNWMSPGSWMGSTPGGPLAEALCLGIASTAKGGGSNAAASPHGHTSSSSTTSSSSSKSSSGDISSQGLNLTK